MMRMDPLGCEEMEMMGEDQEAVGWLRPEQHSSVWNSLNKKPACTQCAEQSLRLQNSSLVFLITTKIAYISILINVYNMSYPPCSITPRGGANGL